MVMIFFTAAIYFFPASVSTMGLVLRRKIGAPRYFSTALMVWLRAGCETCMVLEALVMLPSLMISMIYCACFKLSPILCFSCTG